MNMDNTLQLDPKGYFVIRIKDKTMQIGFCKYQEMHKQGGFTKNIIQAQISSNNEQDLMDWIKGFISQKDHIEYMKRQITKAKTAIKENTRYIQD